MIIRNKESGETIEVMDDTVVAESAWEVVKPEGELVEASDDKDSEIESDTEADTEDAGKSKKK